MAASRCTLTSVRYAVSVSTEGPGLKLMKGKIKAKRMTDNETIAETNNEIIGDFIGKRLDNTSIGFPQQWKLPMCDGYFPSDLAFDKKWERLIPAWYKFYALKFSDRDANDSHYQHTYAIGHAILHKGPSPAEACRLLAEAIRWYKSIKQ